MTRTVGKPRIAVLLDENTSGDGSRYEAAKGYFKGIASSGGLPFGIAYLPEIIAPVLADFDGLLAVGGRFAYPDEWYVGGDRSRSKPSERLVIERALMEGFLARDKPVLGICAGMQMLGCLRGCRLTSDLRLTRPHALDHDAGHDGHRVAIAGESQLYEAVGAGILDVNSFHREALAEIDPAVRVSAVAPDGVVEAIEIPYRRFAIGLQWHQERFADTDHPGNRIFAAFVAAAG